MLASYEQGPTSEACRISKNQKTEAVFKIVGLEPAKIELALES